MFADAHAPRVDTSSTEDEYEYGPTITSQICFWVFAARLVLYNISPETVYSNIETYTTSTPQSPECLVSLYVHLKGDFPESEFTPRRTDHR